MRRTLGMCGTIVGLASAALVAWAVCLAETDVPHHRRRGSEPETVSVRVYNARGKLVGPVESPVVELTRSEWKKRLTPEQFKVLRARDTELPYCGVFVDHEGEGVYVCAGCRLPMFASSSKFHSGTGWPSFMQPVAKENIATRRDLSDGSLRIEVHCPRCGGHMGHVFDDGPPPLHTRFCLNSAALEFVEEEELATLADGAVAEKTEELAAVDGDASRAAPRDAAGERAKTETAVFAGGCFWCMELAFEQLKGAVRVESGYCGGSADTADYESVHSGRTGHAEAIRVTYDPAQLTYDQLLDVFFDSHDPTQHNRQGADVGTQYRSAIFFADATQKKLAEAKIEELSKKRKRSRPIVTTLEPLEKFYPAEELHQDFARKYPLEYYIQNHAVPQAMRVRQKHPNLVVPETKPSR